MAAPYVQKVRLNGSNSSYQSNETVFDCQNIQKGQINCYKCSIEIANCPACDQYRSMKCSRRRCKSESIEADPLREHNRLQEASYDIQHWKRKIVKEYDLYNCACRVDPDKNIVKNDFYSDSFIQQMDVDVNSEHKILHNRILSPVKKLKEQLLPPSHHHMKNQDHGGLVISQSMLLPEVSENSRHLFISCDKYEGNSTKGRTVPSSLQRKPSKVQNKKSVMSCSHPWNQDTPKDCEYSLPLPYYASANHENLHFRQDNSTREVPVPCNEDFYSRFSFKGAKVDIQDRYLRDVEVIRSKLRELRGSTDGKRLRQRSESEPGIGCGGTPAGSSWEAKRARDISPKLASNKTCISSENYSAGKVSSSVSAPLCNYLPIHSRPSHRQEAKLPCIPLQASKDINRAQAIIAGDNTSLEATIHKEGEGYCNGDDGYCREEPTEDSEEDSNSAVSSLTTVSTDSNTPSAVGESLGSISLCDAALPKPIKKEAFGTTDTSAASQALRTSLFSFVPPYIRFSLHDVKGEELPSEISRLMKWKLSPITPIVVRRTLVNSGFKLVRKSNDWCGTWGKHMKSFCFKTLKDFQKINHFPGTFQIGRKDRLWKNLHRLMAKFGKKEFGFIPRTYVLPQDSKLLRYAWEKSCGKEKWIIKPPASARGAGIKVIHRWSQIPKQRALIVQKYISQPYLINGSKFDLRLYVLVTSINPLRIYMYDDGLVRFASVKYSADMASLNDRYMHLTNYSINRLSSQYTQNEDASACQGHKWTVKTLWSYLEKDGVDVKALWDSLVDLVIKTIISGESSISHLTRANLVSRYCSYELFGVDVLLDETLKPWLLEVNISPSLHSSSPLDLAVKGPMVRDLLNMAGYQIPNKLIASQHEDLLNYFALKGKVTSLCYDKRLYSTVLSKDERMKHNLHQQTSSRQEYLDEIIQDLTPDDVRHLIQSEDELSQAGRFIRIFPTPNTHIYHEFFESPRYYNMMFDAWENKYSANRQEGIELLESLCSQKYHLIVTKAPASRAKSSASLQNLQASSPGTAQNFINPQETEEVNEDKSDAERKFMSLSSVALYRAARPRNGKLGVVLKPFPRSGYVARKPKSSTSLSKTLNGAGDIDVECLEEKCMGYNNGAGDNLKIPATFSPNNTQYSK